MKDQPRVAIYCRVSTAEQSVDAQLDDLREYCERRGWTDVQEFVDEGFSGAKDSRPAWNRLNHAIRQRKINVLVVCAIDRIGRSIGHLVKIFSELKENEVQFVSLRESIDLGTAQGQMLAGLFSVMANYELELIRERTAAGMRAAKARGSQVGNRKAFFDEAKAQQLRDRGWGQIRIAKELQVGVGRINSWVRDHYLPPHLRPTNNIAFADSKE